MANPKPLTAKEKADVDRASREAVHRAMGELVGSLGAGLWLPEANRYGLDAVERLKKDSKPPRRVIHKHLAQYIAASAPVHCVDGWGLVARAIAAHAHGDRNSALHLAYYAELRAAMSILASEGTGIFDKQHFVIDETGRCHRIDGSTHVITWQILDYWGTKAAAAQLLQTTVTPMGRGLGEWIDALSTPASWQAIAGDWVRTWGFDLGMFWEDRLARNTASYRPSGMGNWQFLGAREAIGLGIDLWAPFEPTAGEPFAVLDTYILRLSIERAFRSSTGRSPRQAWRKFGRAVKDAATAMIADDSIRDAAVTFLMRNSSAQDPAIFNLAAQAPAMGSVRAASVIARAALLLRIATGAVRELLVAAVPDWEALDFWRLPWGRGRGLWDSDPPEEMTDLWADVEESISSVRAMLQGNPDLSLNSLQAAVPAQLNVIESWDRCPLGV